MHGQKLEKSLSAKTLCGPFDLEFKRKFLGNRSSSMYSQRARLLKAPANPLPISAHDNLLPKIREIEKIAHSGGKRVRANSKAAEVVSELELYLAKKLIANQSTKELITRIEDCATMKSELRWTLPENSSSAPKFAQTEARFYNTAEATLSRQTSILQNRTTYSPSKKWISDQEFKEKFNKFILKQPEEETVKLSDLFGTARTDSPEELMGKIETDREDLEKIVKKMIEERVEESQVEPDDPFPASHPREDGRTSPARNIGWILQRCEDFQRKFKVRRGGKGKKI